MFSDIFDRDYNAYCTTKCGVMQNRQKSCLVRFLTGITMPIAPLNVVWCKIGKNNVAILAYF